MIIFLNILDTVISSVRSEPEPSGVPTEERADRMEIMISHLQQKECHEETIGLQNFS